MMGCSLGSTNYGKDEVMTLKLDMDIFFFHVSVFSRVFFHHYEYDHYRSAESGGQSEMGS